MVTQQRASKAPRTPQSVRPLDAPELQPSAKRAKLTEEPLSEGQPMHTSRLSRLAQHRVLATLLFAGWLLPVLFGVLLHDGGPALAVCLTHDS